MGRHRVPIPSYLNVRGFGRLDELESMLGKVDHDLVIVPAALSDYAPDEAEGKISSAEGELVLRLRPLPKILSKLKGEHVLVGFKAEHGVTERELLESAMRKLEEHGLDMIVANDLTRVGSGTTEVLMLSGRGDPIKVRGTKRSVADSILDEVLKVLT